LENRKGKQIIWTTAYLTSELYIGTLNLKEINGCLESLIIHIIKKINLPMGGLMFVLGWENQDREMK
jgi:hypothetical protein